MSKTGSARAISRFIALRGVVTRRELRERFKSGSVRTTITHLKQLGLVYSSPGRDGFVVSIPWLLYLSEVGADWRSFVEARVPNVGKEELRELEEALRKARRGPLGAFVERLARERPLLEFQEEMVERVFEAIPRECSYPRPGQWRSVDEYYAECVRPLLGYTRWLLLLAQLVASYMGPHPAGRLEELAENLAMQARELAKGTKLVDWEVRLYARTLHSLARILKRLGRQATGEPDAVLDAGRGLQEYFERMLEGLRDSEKYNKRTALRAFIAATVAKILTATPPP